VAPCRKSLSPVLGVVSACAFGAYGVCRVGVCGRVCCGCRSPRQLSGNSQETFRVKSAPSRIHIQRASMRASEGASASANSQMRMVRASARIPNFMSVRGCQRSPEFPISLHWVVITLGRWGGAGFCVVLCVRLPKHAHFINYLTTSHCTVILMQPDRTENSLKYECQCNCGCEQGYDYQPSTTCSECQDGQHQGTVTQRYYQLYWLSKAGTRSYHLDPAFGTPWRFQTYESAYEVGQRLSRPSIEHKLMFEFIEPA